MLILVQKLLNVPHTSLGRSLLDNDDPNIYLPFSNWHTKITFMKIKFLIYFEKCVEPP